MEIDDAMVKRALDAAADYWEDDANNERCSECNGNIYVMIGANGLDYCDSCAGMGVITAGTEEGAMRAALTAVMFGKV